MPRPKKRGVPELGTQLAHYLQAQQMTESELAARAGISQSYISRILAGEVTNPTIEFVVRIAHALNLTVSALLGEEATSPSPSGPPGRKPRDQVLDAIDERIDELRHLAQELRRTEEL